MAKNRRTTEKPYRPITLERTVNYVAMPWANNLDRKPYISLPSCLRLSRVVLEMPHFFWKHIPMLTIKNKRIAIEPTQFYEFFRHDRIPFSTDLLHRYFPPESDQQAHLEWTKNYLATNPDGTRNEDFQDLTLQPFEENHHDPPKQHPEPWQPQQPPKHAIKIQLEIAKSVRATLANRTGLIEEPWNLPVRPDQEDISNRIHRHIALKAKQAQTEEDADAWEEEVTKNWKRWWLGDVGDI